MGRRWKFLIIIKNKEKKQKKPQNTYKHKVCFKEYQEKKLQVNFKELVSTKEKKILQENEKKTQLKTKLDTAAQTAVNTTAGSDQRNARQDLSRCRSQQADVSAA